MALEVDQDYRFYRLFVAFGVSVSSHIYNVPVVGFDGTHSRHQKFHGVILSQIGRDGNPQNVTLTTAFLNVKNTDSISWFFIHCIQAGINLVDVAITCGRGKIQDSVKQVYSIKGVRPQIRFRTLHILRNIKQNFGSSSSGFENAVRKFNQQIPRSTTTLRLWR